MKKTYPKLNLNFGKRLRLGPLSLTYASVLLFFGVGLVYVVTVNVVANKGSELRLMEIENKNLESENQRLEVEAARLKALSVIEDGATGKVEVGDLEPAQPDTQAVVVAPPKMIQTQTLHYLPNYSQLAQR
jgi:hypothetical protein